MQQSCILRKRKKCLVHWAGGSAGLTGITGNAFTVLDNALDPCGNAHWATEMMMGNAEGLGWLVLAPIAGVQRNERFFLPLGLCWKPGPVLSCSQDQALHDGVLWVFLSRTFVTRSLCS